MEVVAGSSRTNGKRYVAIARPPIPAIDSSPTAVIAQIRSRLTRRLSSAWRFGGSRFPTPLNLTRGSLHPHSPIVIPVSLRTGPRSHSTRPGMVQRRCGCVMPMVRTRFGLRWCIKVNRHPGHPIELAPPLMTGTVGVAISRLLKCRTAIHNKISAGDFDDEVPSWSVDGKSIYFASNRWTLPVGVAGWPFCLLE